VDETYILTMFGFSSVSVSYCFDERSDIYDDRF
jgi:hypothetical protein